MNLDSAPLHPDSEDASASAESVKQQAIDATAMLAGLVTSISRSGIPVPRAECERPGPRDALIPQSEYVRAAAAFLYHDASELEAKLPANLVAQVRKYLKAPIGKSAQRKYLDGLWKFFDWCDERGIDVSKLTVDILLAYLDEIFVTKRYRVGMLRFVVAAVNRYHRTLHGRKLSDERVTAALKRYKRERPSKRFRTPKEDEVATLMNSLDPADPKQARDGAVVMIGLAAGFKPVRFPLLRWENTRFHENGGASITFVDRKKKRYTLTLSPGAWPTCPVAWLLRWKEHCKREEGPIFVHVDMWKNYWNDPLKPPSITTILTGRLEQAGLPHLGMGFAGVRTGFLDGLASLGIEDTEFANLAMYERLESAERFRNRAPVFGRRAKRSGAAKVARENDQRALQ